MDNSIAILDAAFALLEKEGPDALTTRAVCDAAGIKAPTLYHYFGGKDGLERAMVERGQAVFMEAKRMPPESADPLDQLRAGWDVAVEFALARPALWRLYARHSLNHPEVFSAGFVLMRSRVQRLIDMRRFVGPVGTAALAIWTANQGVMSLILQGRSDEEVKQMSDLLFQAVVARLSSEHMESPPWAS